MANNLYCENPQPWPEQFWMEPVLAQTNNDLYAPNVMQRLGWPMNQKFDAVATPGVTLDQQDQINKLIIQTVRKQVDEMHQRIGYPYAQQITDNLDKSRLLICAMDGTTAYIARARTLNFHTDFDDVVYDRLMTSLLAVIEYVINTSFDPMTHGLTYEQVMAELSPERLIISCGENMARDIYDVVQVLTSVKQYNVCLEYVPVGQEVYMSYSAFVQGLAYEYMQDLQRRSLITNDPVGINLSLNYQVHSVGVEKGRVSLVVHAGFV